MTDKLIRVEDDAWIFTTAKSLSSEVMQVMGETVRSWADSAESGRVLVLPADTEYEDRRAGDGWTPVDLGFSEQGTSSGGLSWILGLVALFAAVLAVVALCLVLA